MTNSGGNIQKGLVLVAALTLLLTSCGLRDADVVQTDEVTVPTIDEVTTSETIEPTTDDESDRPQPAHAASGLTLTNADGTWWIDLQGNLQLLIDKQHASLSPDRKWIAYLEEDPSTYLYDIWLMDTATGDRRNVTQTPDRDEGHPTWVPGRADRLVFGSGTESGMSNEMLPTVVGIDGSGYRILDPENGVFKGISPDGETIYYGGYEATQWSLAWDGEATVFDPAEFGLPADKLFIPSWSSDGRRVAWYVTGDFDASGSTQLGIAVFDLESLTAQVMHTFVPMGGSSFSSELTWSPDGEWLAFTTQAEPPDGGRIPRLWIMRPDGSDEAYIGEGASPTWKYDGQSLAFIGWNEAQTEEVYLATAGSWDVTRLDDVPLPERILFLLDWVVP